MMKLNVVYPTIKLFFFIQNVFDLTISPIKKELDLHVASDGSIKEDKGGLKEDFVFVVVVRAAGTFLSFISYFIYSLKVTIVQC